MTPVPAPERAPGPGRRGILVFLMLLGLCWLVYGGNGHHRLLHWDDITYVSANPWVTDPSPAHVRELFTQVRALNWHPLTWLSYIPEYRACGERAACYKAVNIVLHAANAFLVYWLCLLLLARTHAGAAVGTPTARIAAACAAALFAAHPQHVESVIWVAERKDLLCGAFFLLAVICYLRQHGRDEPRRSALPFLFFVLSAMSKSMAVTLPAVLVILDFHPLGRFRNASVATALRIAVLEKLHFHLLALAVLLVALYSQDVGVVEQPALLQRVAIATSAFWHYVASFFWPFPLSPFYPVAIVEQGLGRHPVAFALATLLVLGAIAKAGGRPAIAFLAYFLVTLVPVIGLLKVGEQAYADRYTYLPMVGWYVLVGWLIAAGSLRLARPAPVIVGVAVALLLPLGALARTYKETWRSDHALWSHVASLHPGLSATVHNNLGNSLYEAARYREAIAEYERGAAAEPQRSDVHANIGLAYEALGQRDQALRAFERGVASAPRDAWARVAAGDAYDRQGRLADATRHYVSALQLDPGNAYAAFGLGKALLIAGRANSAIALLNTLEPAFPRHLDARLLVAQAYLPGDPQRAAEILDDAEQRYGTRREIALLRQRIAAAEGK